MEEERLTAEQIVERIGSEDVTLWKLERWHKADLISRPIVEHLGYGKGTRSTYPAHTVAQVLAVCRFLKQKHKLNVVRFQLWREEYPIPLAAVKKTVRQLVPPLNWTIPHRTEPKYDAADTQALTIFHHTLGRVRDGVLRSMIHKLKSDVEKESFVTIQTYLLYGIRYDFANNHDDEKAPADIIAQGLGLEQFRFLPKDLTSDLQQLSKKGFLSLVKMRNALNEATEEDLLLARTRMEMIGPLFECFEIMGYLPHSWHLAQQYIGEPVGQALFLVFLIVLEKQGLGVNIEMVLDATRTNLPMLRLGQAVHLALSQELPLMAKELLSIEKMGRLAVERQAGSQEAGQQFEAYLARIRMIYVQHKTELDAFWQRHPEWVIE